MYKGLFTLYYRLIATPVASWNRLAEEVEVDNEQFNKSYLFPSWGLVALASFLGALFFSAKEVAIQMALKEAIRAILLCGGSFYTVSYLLSEWLMPKVEHPKNRSLAERFVGYSLSLSYAVHVISSLLPGFFLIFLVKLSIFYTIYLVWTGALHFLKLEERYWVRFTIWASVMLLLIPLVLEVALGYIIPGMN